MDLLAFVQDIDSREWIEYRNIQKITVVFLYYLQLLSLATLTPDEELEVCKDLRQIAKVYTKTPPVFMDKIQEKFNISEELVTYSRQEYLNTRVKDWIFRILDLINSESTRQKLGKDFEGLDISQKEKIIQEYEYEDEYDDTYDYQDSFLNVENSGENVDSKGENSKGSTQQDSVQNTAKNYKTSHKKNHYRKNGHVRKLQKGMGGHF